MRKCFFVSVFGFLCCGDDVACGERKVEALPGDGSEEPAVDGRLSSDVLRNVVSSVEDDVGVHVVDNDAVLFPVTGTGVVVRAATDLIPDAVALGVVVLELAVFGVRDLFAGGVALSARGADLFPNAVAVFCVHDLSAGGVAMNARRADLYPDAVAVFGVRDLSTGGLALSARRADLFPNAVAVFGVRDLSAGGVALSAGGADLFPIAVAPGVVVLRVVGVTGFSLLARRAVFG
jgi:hypothetical protein